MEKREIYLQAAQKNSCRKIIYRQEKILYFSVVYLTESSSIPTSALIVYPNYVILFFAFFQDYNFIWAQCQHLIIVLMIFLVISQDFSSGLPFLCKFHLTFYITKITTNKELLFIQTSCICQHAGIFYFHKFNVSPGDNFFFFTKHNQLFIKF